MAEPEKTAPAKPIDWGRVHIDGDRARPFSVIRYAEPSRTLRYGKPGLIERIISKVFG